MTKKTVHPPYFKIFAILGAALLTGGLWLLVTHVTVFSTYAIVYAGIAFLLIGGVGTLLYKPKIDE